MSRARPYVVYWSNIPSPYQVARLNAVAHRSNVEIEAWFCSEREPDRSWTVDELKWDFKYRYVPGGRLTIPGLGTHYFNIPTTLMTKRRPQLLVSLYAEPAFLAGWAVARNAGTRTAFRVLPTFDSWVARSEWKERIKRFVFPRVDGFKVPGPDGAQTVVRYGVDPTRIHQVTQSIDVQLFQEGRSKWRPHRDRIRADLGLQGCVFLYVGRIWRGKGLDYLFDAYAQLQKHPEPASLLIVGDGVDERRYRSLCGTRGLPRVVFTGFVEGDDLCRLYAASDVFVFPTLGDPHGLVVEEAMASALPIISSDAAGDISIRIEEGVTGYVVPAADSRALTERMLHLTSDRSARVAMGQAAAGVASKKGHATYAADFERFVDAVLSSRRAGAGREASST